MSNRDLFTPIVVAETIVCERCSQPYSYYEALEYMGKSKTRCPMCEVGGATKMFLAAKAEPQKPGESVRLCPVCTWVTDPELVLEAVKKDIGDVLGSVSTGGFVVEVFAVKITRPKPVEIDR